ncbi:MAG: hypothetical protein M1816_002014 [Peltula sp. TS41687]|nr:MAG: hypothetical protein M1816_002014 [Peltula sp. TS41687]
MPSPSGGPPPNRNPNPFLLCAENNQPALLPLLRSQPSLIHTQDSSGYSLLHAAASYGHVELLRTLATTFGGDINLRDGDGETALFAAERVEVARLLVEELGADVTRKNDDGLTAAEKLEADAVADEPGALEVAAYLRGLDRRDDEGDAGEGTSAAQRQGRSGRPPPAQVGFRVVGRRTVEEEEGEGEGEGEGEEGEGQVVDEEVRRRIEELAGREDFSAEEGQRELRRLVADVVRGHVVGGTGGEEEDERDRTRRRVG